MTPTTSESIPLLGVFFSAVTFIVAMSISFTILILNIRYRQNDNHIMSQSFRSLFVEFIPWLMLMKRPGHKFVNRQIVNVMSSLEADCMQCASRESGNSLSSCHSDEEPDRLSDSFTPSFYNLPGERLRLDRKVGEVGIL
uniref:Neur_chan_memb domain-containing protein n=1 Tax=Heterorhabditis bacteriophora TaxID=37862 RepID=A0A1I7WTV9_HETBA